MTKWHLVCDPSRPKKSLWLTAGELRHVQAIRTSKHIGPVIIVRTERRKEGA